MRRRKNSIKRWRKMEGGASHISSRMLLRSKYQIMYFLDILESVIDFSISIGLRGVPLEKKAQQL